MPGNLYLGCGSAADEAALWRSMFHRPITRVVYWPFALPAEMSATADQWLRDNLDQLGVGYQLDSWPDLDHHDVAELDTERVDLLFVGGGNTFRLLDQIRHYGFIEPVRQFWLAGGDYYGGSAGAVLATENIAIAEVQDQNEPGLQDLTSLGLLSAVTLLPHFTDDQLGDAARWAAAHDTVVLGLPESAGLRCHDGRATVVGTGQLTRLTGDTVERFPSGSTLDLAMR